MFLFTMIGESMLFSIQFFLLQDFQYIQNSLEIFLDPNSIEKANELAIKTVDSQNQLTRTINFYQTSFLKAYTSFLIFISIVCLLFVINFSYCIVIVKQVLYFLYSKSICAYIKTLKSSLLSNLLHIYIFFSSYDLSLIFPNFLTIIILFN